MIKNTKGQLEVVEENIKRVKTFSDKLSGLNSNDKNEFWKSILTIIDESIEGSKHRIMAILNDNNLEHPWNILATLKYHAGCVNAYDSIKRMVINNEEVVAEAAARIKELQAKKEEIANNIDLQ